MGRPLTKRRSRKLRLHTWPDEGYPRPVSIEAALRADAAKRLERAAFWRHHGDYGTVRAQVRLAAQSRRWADSYRIARNGVIP